MDRSPDKKGYTLGFLWIKLDNLKVTELGYEWIHMDNYQG